MKPSHRVASVSSLAADAWPASSWQSLPGLSLEDGTAEDFADHLDDVMNAEDFIIPADRGQEFASYLPRLGFEFSAATPLVKET